MEEARNPGQVLGGALRRSDSQGRSGQGGDSFDCRASSDQPKPQIRAAVPQLGPPHYGAHFRAKCNLVLATEGT